MLSLGNVTATNYSLTYFNFGEIFLGRRVGRFDDDDKISVGKLAVRLVRAKRACQLVHDEDRRVQDLLLVRPVWFNEG